MWTRGRRQTPLSPGKLGVERAVCDLAAGKGEKTSPTVCLGGAVRHWAATPLPPPHVAQLLLLAVAGQVGCLGTDFSQSKTLFFARGCDAISLRAGGGVQRAGGRRSAFVVVGWGALASRWLVWGLRRACRAGNAAGSVGTVGLELVHAAPWTTKPIFFKKKNPWPGVAGHRGGDRLNPGGQGEAQQGFIFIFIFGKFFLLSLSTASKGQARQARQARQAKIRYLARNVGIL